MITGGSEATVTPMAIGGFANMKALSERNESPETASRPFDATRDGFVMGEGGGIVILEELEHARKRGARIYAEIVGYGATGDAYHLTAPAPEGEGAQRAMRRAMKDARLAPGRHRLHQRARHVDARQRSQRDARRSRRCSATHAYKVNVSSTKSMTGHMLGAAGAVEFIIGALADARLRSFRRRSTTRRPIPSSISNYTPNTAVKRAVRAVLSNSFGFGGHNVSLAIKRFEE